MSFQGTSTDTVWDSAQFVATQLVRKPVKEAVREALREEAAVESGGSEDVKHEESSERRPTASDQGDQSGRSIGAWIGAILVIGGIAYLARRRMSSATGTAWSEPSPGAVAEDDAESGYTSEGEMQTAETAGGSDGDAE